MTEEEMRARITELENKNKELENNFNTVSEQIKTKESEITSLNSNISELKQKNYDLFIQVSTPMEKEKPVEIPKDTMSTSDIISKLIGGE